MAGGSEVNCGKLLKKNLLVTLTLAGVFVGFIVGLAVAPSTPSKSALMWIGMAGELYIRMLKMTIVPLVVCNIISGTASMDPRSNGRISGASLAYVLITNSVPAFIGTLFCVLIKPGSGVASSDSVTFTDKVMESEDIFADLLRNVVPDNIVTACFQQAQTKYEYKTKEIQNRNGEVNTTARTSEVVIKFIGTSNSSNILGLIIISAMFGVGAATLTENGRPFLTFFKSSRDIIMRVIKVLIWSTPVGVASLVAKAIASTTDIEDTFRKLGLYFVTTMTGLVVYVLIIIPFVYYVVKRRNPFRFFATFVPSIMISFATGSTTIALPETIYSLEEKNGIDKCIARLVPPFFCATSRGGSAIYISISCIFIMQSLQLGVNFANAFFVSVLTMVFTLAIPSIAGASLISVLILLSALNIPGETAAMLFPFEFFLDRARTVANFILHVTGVVVVEALSESTLTSFPESETAIEDVDLEACKIEESALLETRVHT